MKKLSLFVSLLLLLGCGARCKPIPATCHYDVAKYEPLSAPGSQRAITVQGKVYRLQYSYRVKIGATLKNAQGGKLGPMPAIYPCAHWEVFSYISPDDPSFKTNLVRPVADDDPEAACHYAPDSFLVP